MWPARRPDSHTLTSNQHPDISTIPDRISLTTVPQPRHRPPQSPPAARGPWGPCPHAVDRGWQRVCAQTKPRSLFPNVLIHNGGRKKLAFFLCIFYGLTPARARPLFFRGGFPIPRAAPTMRGNDLHPTTLKAHQTKN